MKNFSHMPCS